jgi:DNA-binding XRE family transcriptional regulator
MWKNYFHVKLNCLHLGYDKIFRTRRTKYEKAAMTTTISPQDPGCADVYDEAARDMSDIAEETFPVRPRGRPKTKEDEAKKREDRRILFGSKLRSLREGRGLTLADAAQRAGISSPRKLSQYETTCYPPGWVIRAIAPVYGVREGYLAELVLKHNDPDLHHALMSDIDEGEIQNA